MKLFHYFLPVFFLLYSLTVIPQCLVPVNLVKQKDLPMPFPTIQLNMTAHRDTSASKPYLYISGTFTWGYSVTPKELTTLEPIKYLSAPTDYHGTALTKLKIKV